MCTPPPNSCLFRDFAWAAAPNWVWEASNVDGILIQTLYRPSADKWAHGEAAKAYA